MRKLIVCAMLLLILAGCNKGKSEPQRWTAFDNLIDHAKPLAMGDDRDVYIFCDPANWKALEPFVRSAIEREIQLVYPEKYFQIIMSDIKDAEALSKHKNLIFIGDLKTETPVSKYAKSVLDKDFIARVNNSGGDLFTAKNHSSRDQLVMFLMGKDPVSLSKIGALQSDNIFGLLLHRFAQRQAYYAYQGKIIAASFFKSYPFAMQIPDTYRLFSNDKDGRFLSFLYRAKMQNREIPDKYISVYYEAMPENKLDMDWLKTKRKELGQKYFEGDTFDAELVRQEPFRFIDHDGFRLMGAWKNEKHAIGGAFQSYAFWDEPSKTAYLIDNIVYFPAGDKLPILVELFMLSSSITLK
jgi:hypothetical protein